MEHTAERIQVMSDRRRTESLRRRLVQEVRNEAL
jgi:hypothetical protein